MINNHMRAVLAVLLLSAAAFADDFPWYAVQIDTNNTDAVEGRPATLRLALPCLNCASPVSPIDLPVQPNDVITWSFGDGSPDVSVTGSARVTHTFPRGWFDVVARLGTHTFRKRVFSAPVFIDPPSYVGFATPLSSYVSEAAGAYVIHLVRSGNLSVSTTIGFSMEGATEWLTTTSGAVTFAPGETSKDISIGLVNDALYEGTRGIAVTIWSVDGATLRNIYPVPPNVAVFQTNFGITDDDPRPALSVDNVVVTEGNDGNSAVAFNVRLSAAAGRDLTFNYTLGGGTAKSGEDYVAPPNADGTLTIPAGATSVAFPVAIVGDRIAEPDETLRFQITYADVFSPVVATCTILNDDVTLTPDFVRVLRGTQTALAFDLGNPVI